MSDEIYLESGMMQIQAGPAGAIAWSLPTDGVPAWQTPAERASLQRSEFVLSIGPSAKTPEAEAMRPMMRSRSAIAWYPTFEPFQAELPKEVDWIHFGRFEPLSSEEKTAGRLWRTRDDSNPELLKRLPDALVRNRVLESVSADLLLAGARGAELSIDPLHAAVLSGRLVDPRTEGRGFALRFLIPRAGEMTWEDIAEVRKHRAMRTLRRVLRDIEDEALSEVASAGEVAEAVRRRHVARVERYALDTPTLGSTLSYGIAEVAVGGVVGFATAGLGWVGVVAGLIPGVTLGVSEGFKHARVRRSRDWISALQSVRDAAGP